MPHHLQFVQFLGIYLVERYRTRRLIAVLADTTRAVRTFPTIAGLRMVMEAQA